MLLDGRPSAVCCFCLLSSVTRGARGGEGWFRLAAGDPTGRNDMHIIVRRYASVYARYSTIGTRGTDEWITWMDTPKKWNVVRRAIAVVAHGACAIVLFDKCQNVIATECARLCTCAFRRKMEWRTPGCMCSSRLNSIKVMVCLGISANLFVRFVSASISSDEIFEYLSKILCSESNRMPAIYSITICVLNNAWHTFTFGSRHAWYTHTHTHVLNPFHRHACPTYLCKSLAHCARSESDKSDRRKCARQISVRTAPVSAKRAGCPWCVCTSRLCNASRIKIPVEPERTCVDLTSLLPERAHCCRGYFHVLYI